MVSETLHDNPIPSTASLPSTTPTTTNSRHVGILRRGEAHELYSILNSKRQLLGRLENKTNFLLTLSRDLVVRFMQDTFHDFKSFNDVGVWKRSIDTLINPKDAWSQANIASHLLALTVYLLSITLKWQYQTMWFHLR